MQTHTQSNRASAFHLQNWTAKEDGVAIDSSLARGVRRAYFKRLYAHYQTYLERVHNAYQRNQSPFSKIIIKCDCTEEKTNGIKFLEKNS